MLRSGDVVARVVSDVAGLLRLRAQGVQKALEGDRRGLALADLAADENRPAEACLLRFTLLQGIPTIGQHGYQDSALLQSFHCLLDSRERNHELLDALHRRRHDSRRPPTVARRVC